MLNAQMALLSVSCVLLMVSHALIIDKLRGPDVKLGARTRTLGAYFFCAAALLMVAEIVMKVAGRW